MGLFQVVFNRHEKFSSDANVGSTPVQGATVVSPVHQADIVHVEAETADQAEQAVLSAYNGHTSDVVVSDVPTALNVEPVAADGVTDQEQTDATDKLTETQAEAKTPDTAESVQADATTEPEKTEAPVEST